MPIIRGGSRLMSPPPPTSDSSPAPSTSPVLASPWAHGVVWRLATPPHPQPHSPKALMAGRWEAGALGPHLSLWPPWCMYLAKCLTLFRCWLPYLYCRGCRFWKAGQGSWVCTSGLELRVEWGLCRAHNLCLTYLCPNLFQY